MDDLLSIRTIPSSQIELLTIPSSQTQTMVHFYWHQDLFCVLNFFKNEPDSVPQTPQPQKKKKKKLVVFGDLARKLRRRKERKLKSLTRRRKKQVNPFEVFKRKLRNKTRTIQEMKKKKKKRIFFGKKPIKRRIERFGEKWVHWNKKFIFITIKSIQIEVNSLF